jgi:hypothetical protein
MEEMTREQMAERINHLEEELKKSKESIMFWIDSQQKTENKLNSVLSTFENIIKMNK